jgi:N-acetylneuraminate synthase
MKQEIRIGDLAIGDGHRVFVVAEIGINHNGDLETAKKLIAVAASAGCNAVKFQKRTPEVCVSESQRDLVRETPWGLMSYLEYRRRVEFGRKEFEEIDRYCRTLGILWFASCWDEASVDFIEGFDPVCHKVASACLTDDALLTRIRACSRPVILSTGMSTMEEIRHAISLLDRDRLILAHCTSAYPCKPEELNLTVIKTLRSEFGVPVGYSGHEVGLQTTVATVALGAALIERHITLDRSMWGSDQAASVEPGGLNRLVRDIRVVEAALGDGCKRVFESEAKPMERLRRTLGRGLASATKQ